MRKGVDYGAVSECRGRRGPNLVTAQRVWEENAFDISNELKNVMFTDVGIYRTGSGMENALDKLQELKERYKNVKVSDTGKIFNTELMNAWELGNMLDVAGCDRQCAKPDGVTRRTCARGLSPGMTRIGCVTR